MSKKTTESALALKGVLGEIKMEPITEDQFDPDFIINGLASAPSEPRNDEEFKPYYVAHTKIETLALLDQKHKGSNWYHWRRR